ncbi:MAG: hypothetical protein PHC28_00020 [Flavobacterium sp.]|uniref:hypothetical protein n=1 Tax=Flavobacterium sp. TaxID=239 RepID=UPI002624FC8A|nr:hypothetical protein [Flavobacterium sp.]MDD5148852.1 hypothetical protein [Flavobacterium sp.]
MKNNLLKYCLIAFCLCINFVMFAQAPGSNNDTGNLETDDAPAAPIDNYLWVLALVGLVFVFLRFKAIQDKKIQS